jgi:hypothetical protein
MRCAALLGGSDTGGQRWSCQGVACAYCSDRHTKKCGVRCGCPHAAETTLSRYRAVSLDCPVSVRKSHDWTARATRERMPDIQKCRWNVVSPGHCDTTVIRRARQACSVGQSLASSPAMGLTTLKRSFSGLDFSGGKSSFASSTCVSGSLCSRSLIRVSRPRR